MRRYFILQIKTAMRRCWALGGLTAMLAGCVSNPGDTQNLTQRGMDTVVVRPKAESDANRAMGLQTVKIHTIHNSGYVALSDMAMATGYQGAWLDNGGLYAMGDTDVVWTVQTGDSTVNKAGRQIRMPAPAVRDNGRMLIPVSGLKPLFGDEAVMAAGPFGISVLPRPTMYETGADGSSLPFHDAAGRRPARQAAALIAYAKRFTGARYEFGAKPFAAGGTFDCSSYVQQVMSRFGVDLPRSARLQAEAGLQVPRDELLPGDLLFFNVSGRYKSQATPGHVGIYMGAGKMIHAAPGPENGVQITSLNTPFHLRSFLYAKRVVG